MSSRDYRGFDEDFRHDDRRARDDYSRQESYESPTYGGKTSDFDSAKLMGDERNFFGFKLSPGMAGAADSLFSISLPTLYRFLEDKSENIATSFAKKYLTHLDSSAAKLFGHKVGSAVGWATIFAKQIDDAVSIGGSTISSLNELRLAVEPIARANGYKGGLGGVLAEMNSHNEVVNNALKKIYAVAAHKGTNSAVNMIKIAPAIMGKISEKQIKDLEKKKDLKFEEFDNLSDEDKAKFFETEMNTGWKLEETKAKNFEKVLELKRKAYEEEFKQFKQKNKTEIARQLEAELGQIKTSARGGTERLHPRLDALGLWGGDLSKYKGTTKDAKAYKELLEKRIKQEFAIKKGAFDQEWQALIPSNFRQHDTHASKFEKAFDEQWTRLKDRNNPERKGQDKEVDPRITEGVTSAGAALAGEILTNSLGINQTKKLREEVAFDMILHMRRAIDENPARELIPGRGQSSDEFSYAQYVHKIFEKHQHDCKKPEIGERYYTHLHEAGWQDSAIQKLEDKDLTPYEVAVKHIAKYIQDGRMDALALVNLVGQRKIVNSSGKSFGSQGKKGSEEQVKEGLIKEIDRQCALLKPHHAMDEDKVSEQTGNYTFSPEELKVVLGPKGLKGEERAFLFSLVDSMITDEKVLRKFTGLSEKETEKLRLEAQGRYKKLMSAAVLELADAAEKDSTLIKKQKLTDEQLGSIDAIAGEIKETGKTADELIDNGNKALVATTLANVMMEDKTFFRDKIEPASKKLPERKCSPDNENGSRKYADKFNNSKGLEKDIQSGRMGDEQPFGDESHGGKDGASDNWTQQFIGNNKVGFDDPGLMSDKPRNYRDMVTSSRAEPQFRYT